MKTRSDFVSNSSSSSYIVSVPKSLGLEAFSQKLAESCSSASDEWHDDEIVKDNFRKLDFCLNTYELLFFGRLTMEEKEHTTSFAELEKKFSRVLAEAHWRMITQSVYESEYRKAFGDDTVGMRDYVDEVNKVYHHFEPQIIERIIVDKYALNDFVAFGMNRPKTKFDDEHLEKLKKKFEAVYKGQNGSFSFNPYIDIYQITKNTIRVTEALRKQLIGKLDVSSGYKKNDELYNSIKAHVKNGNSVCYVTVNYQGGGIDAYSVYQEDGSNGMSDVLDVEVLGTEAG